MCRRQDNGLQIWYVPRQNDKPCTDSERAQKWRLSLASLLFFTVLLSDYLWLCAEANLTRSRDQERSTSAEPTGGNRSLSPLFLSADQPRSTASSDKRAIFLGNTTSQLEPCRPYYVCEQCVSIEDAETVCGSAGEEASNGSPPLSFNNFHLSFCESYTLSELFAGMSRPEGSNCDLSLVLDGDATVCVQCVEIYQRLDQHAQEKYEEFQSLFQKYLQWADYSVKSCIDDCKVRAWSFYSPCLLLGCVGEYGVGHLSVSAWPRSLVAGVRPDSSTRILFEVCDVRRTVLLCMILMLYDSVVFERRMVLVIFAQL